MDAIRGNATIEVQRVERPYIAPACEYVAMPDGSSSLAPVTRPGPSTFQNRLGFFEERFLPFINSKLMNRIQLQVQDKKERTFMQCRFNTS
jgi:hypothetical protein